ncbi:LysR family transcriptional regulator [Lactobacillus johnsonii]|uniref:LysR family transcriptional regulator n=1 Tax=Lactobacillus johnsonii TaxID=33959 RepID=UPI000E3350A1|nr:LysR family transcriptional regulator [Lactobacillus johnsonii]AXQ20007.1 LysR family transcriptional regulator [Lactobacillus johnsonii]KAB1959326.1 LysR family transcriptional regulator [Lactobacillus johnsonii]MCT3346616.1 LysR family transcriptional regulator [Lactobacillus johnsonii]
MNNPEEIQHFIDVLLKEDSFVKAAKKLYISQPYLTQLIKRIEDRLGTPIIDRDKKPYALTQAGLLYYQYLENISYNKQQLNKKLAQYTHPNKEIIRIGILESLGTYLLPEILPDFLNKNPRVEIQLFENFPRESERNLLSGNIDCYIGQTPEAIDSSLDIVSNGGERYYVVISPSSPYYQEGKFILKPDDLNLKDLLQEPFVLSVPGSAIRHQVNGVFQRFHLEPRVVLESKNIITATSLAIHGMGLTISTASIIKKIGETPINLFPLSYDLINVTFFIATKAEKTKSQALKNLVEEFKKKNLQPIIR